MSKEEFLKIQTCVLKVNIHCEGCEKKVKKILHKIEGVYTIAIDSELGKVTVSGNVDPDALIKKLNKNGKSAELWGAKPNSHTQMSNKVKVLQIGTGKHGGSNKNQLQKGQANAHPKGEPPHPQVQNQQQLQQLQLHQMKAFQDLKNQMKVAANDKDQKAAKLSLPELEEGLSDDDFESDDEFDDFDDEDEIEAAPVNKMKPVMGNGQEMPGVTMMMKNMMNGQQEMKSGGANGGAGGKKGVPGNIPVQVNTGAINDAAGKKGGAAGAQNQGSGKGGKNATAPPRNGDGNPTKNAIHGGAAPNFMGNKGMNDGPPPNMMPAMHPGVFGGNPNAAAMAHPLMNQIGNPPAFPAAAYGHFPSEPVPGNPYQLQQQQPQYAAMMMNAQRANGNERFQPMVYARPPPAVSYMPSSYPYYHQVPNTSDRGDEFAMFSDENTESCTVM